MLTMNIWTKGCLCNGALGTLKDFVFKKGQTPPRYQFVFLFSLMKSTMVLLSLLNF